MRKNVVLWLLIACVLTASSIVAYNKFHTETIEIIYAQTFYVENYGDTFEDIIGKHYHKCTNKRKWTWEEYRSQMKSLNPHLLDDNGFLKAVHVNDPINVEWYVERKQEK